MGFKVAAAKRSGLKLKMALTGPSGAGKTMSALKIARAIVGPSGRIGVVDTENGKASLYVGEDGVSGFDVGTLEGDYSPERYIEAIKELERLGYDAVVIDSASHEWMGPGGCLDMVDTAAQRMKGNSYAAWKDITPRHTEFIHAMLHSKCHVLATFRSKQEYDQQQDANGKKQVVKLGFAPITRDGVEYEFDVVGDLDISHNMVFSKTRCRALDGKTFRMPGENVAAVLRDWLMTAPAGDSPKAPPNVTTKYPNEAAHSPSQSETPESFGAAVQRLHAELDAANGAEAIRAVAASAAKVFDRSNPEHDGPRSVFLAAYNAKMSKQ